VLKNYPEVERIMFRLRNKPCMSGCKYCNNALDIHKGLKRFFGFDAFRSYGGELLQEKAVKAAVDNKSILAVFPTGGGKSKFPIPCAPGSALCYNTGRGSYWHSGYRHRYHISGYS
jgi:ATP-dependent DNA helicase RecQ